MSIGKKNYKFFIMSILLILISIISIFLMSNLISGRTTKLDEVSLKNENKVPDGLAIMLENDTNDGKYNESTSSMWPSSTDYRFNKELSGCIDSDGNTVSDALTYDKSTNSVKIKTRNNISCYMYFDLKFYLSELCSSGDNLGSCISDNNEEIDSLNNNIEGGLYRYQGTNIDLDDNYICFGTGDKEECTSNTDAYMYRIIGIDSNGQLKLIKKEALNTSYYWHNDRTSNTSWTDSDLFKGLNGISGGQYSNLFIGNSTYMPSGWSDKIADTNWKIGDNTNVNQTAQALYNTENGWTAGQTAYKIGLMYVHDYAYGMSGGNNCSISGAYSICKTSWMFITNSDSGTPSQYEWTMSRYGQNSDGYYYARRVLSDGYVSYANLYNTNAVRPVFYLNSDEQYISGDGTLDNPIMLEAPKTLSTMCETGDNLGECLIDNKNEIESLNNNIEGGLYRYQGTNEVAYDNYICFGTSDKDTCTGNTDAYMYRIIGINSSGQLKLIKKEALNTAYYWHNTYSSNTTWPNSDLYKGLNGISGGQYSNLFIGNSTYMPSGWSDKIADTSWKYGDNTNVNQTASALYTTENGWTTTTAKIGLMYAHDYAYGMSGGNNCSSSGAYSTCKTSWLFLGNNDSGSPSAHEWTMSRYGYFSGYYGAWYVFSNGVFNYSTLNNTFAVRPVFYLNSEEQYISGDGTLDNPIIVSEPELTPIGEYIQSTKPTGLNSTMEGGLYRYQGTTANNYICFGTSDKDTCIGNTDAYMYRIIGIDENNQLKLIKKEALNTTYYWHNSYSSNITWPNSDLYKGLNGKSGGQYSNLFIGNSTYMPSGWSDKIADTSWKYGDNTNESLTASALSLYTTENGWTNTTTAKIGLMYAHDYAYGMSGGNNCSGSGAYTTCKTSWMFITNSDPGTPSQYEWTMSRYGKSGSRYLAWFVHSNGYFSTNSLSNTYVVRPVFYLKSSVNFIGGTGAESDPFLVS